MSHYLYKWLVCLVLMCIPAIGNAFVVGDLAYDVRTSDESTVNVHAASTEISGDIIIPDSVEYEGKVYKVVALGGGDAFISCENLNSVVIPNSVKMITGSAFKWCSNLTSVKLPDSLETIPNQAFNQCFKLADVTIPSTVTTIEYDAFKACEKLSPLTVPAGVSTIGSSAFSGIDTIYYSGSASGAPWGAGVATEKKKVALAAGTYFVVGDYKYKVENTEGTVSISAASTDIAGAIELPSKVVYDGVEYTVTIVDGSGFETCAEITSVVIPNSVIEIRGSAFKWCSKLTSVTIPEHITKIPTQCFNQCYNLVDFTIPSVVTLIEVDAFKACEKLSPLTVPDGVTSIGRYAFSGIDTVYYSGSATGAPWSAGVVIGKDKPSKGSTFVVGDYKYKVESDNTVAISAANTDIEGDLVLPSTVVYDGVEYTVTIVDGGGFRSCGDITSVVIPNTVQEIRGSAFKWCSSLTSVTIPEGITKIPNQCFNQCYNLESLTIPSGVTLIEYDAFKACEKLSPLTVPDGAARIEYDAFYGIDTVYYSGTASGNPWSAGIVIGKDKPTKGSYFVVGDYKYKVEDDKANTVAISAANTDIAGDLVLPSTVVYDGVEYTVIIVDGGGFRSCGEITSVVIPNSVQEIRGSAFKWCSKLTSVTIPDSITKIPNQCFNQCYNLESLTIPAGVTLIEYDAFKACEKLSPLTVPDGASSIEYDAFYGIDTVYYSGSATGSPWSAGRVIEMTEPTLNGTFVVGDFRYTITDTTNHIVAIAAANTDIAGDIVLPSSVEFDGVEYTVGLIGGEGVFRSCSEITSVVIPNSVKTISGSAFKWCSKLVSVTLPDSITKIPNQCFNQCYNLVDVTIPSGVTSIEYDAFKACEKLSPLTISDDVTSIEYDAFAGIDTVYYSGDATGNPWGAGIVIGKNKPTKGSYFVVGDYKYKVEDDKELTVAISAASTEISGDLELPSKVVYDGLEYTVIIVDGGGFRSCTEITSVVIPNTVQEIRGSAFKWCSSLTSVTIPEHITKIPNQCFNQCYNLESLTIPSGVTLIEYDAFKACEKLSPLTVPDSASSIEYDAFYGIDTVYYSGIATGNPWSAGVVIGKDKPSVGGAFVVGDFRYTITDTTNHIVAVAAANTDISGDIVIPSSVEIDGVEYTVGLIGGEGVFRSCGEITSVVIPNSVKTISGSAFKWCSKLVSVTLPDSITKIPNQCFNQCYNLVDVTIPAGVTSIEYDAFKACEKLSPLTISDDVTSIEYDAFSGIDTVYYSGDATGNPWGAGVVIGKDKPVKGSYFIVGDYKYKVESDKEHTVAISAASTDIAGDLVLPSTVVYDGVEYTVVIVDGGGFRSCGEITSVVIPNSVQEIRGSAFKWCSKLTSVTIPEHITKIPNQCFNQCYNLESLTIPSGVTLIEYDAFKACEKLSPLTVPDSASSIEYDAFYGIDTVYYSGDATGNPWSAGVVIGKDKPVKGSYFIVGDYKYKVESDKEHTVAISAANTDIAGDLVLPSTVVYDGVEYTVIIVDGGGFRSCGEITSVVIPNSVQEIRGSAFKWCSKLTSVTIPEHITKIPNQCFNQCYNLEDLTIPSGVTLIEYDAFKACEKLSPLTVPDVASSIEYDAFYDIDTVYYSGSATGNPWGAGIVISKVQPTKGSYFIVGDYKYKVEDDKELTVAISAASTEIAGDLELPSKVVYNGLEYTVTIVDGGGFRSCAEITSVVIPNTVQEIRGSAFKWCSKLTSVTIPEHITKIPNQCFNQCYNLESLTIPSGVTLIEYDAFKACGKLSPLTVPDVASSIEYDAFSGIDTVYYAGSAKGTPWGAGVVIGKDKTTIGSVFIVGDFRYTVTDTTNHIVAIAAANTDIAGDIVLPSSVEFDGVEYTVGLIGGEGVFRSCSEITSVVIPNSVKSISGSAFKWCSKLTSVTLPDSIDKIPNQCFNQCYNLVDVTIPAGVTSIEYDAFKACEKLSPLTVPDGVTTIEYNAFYDIDTVYYAGSAAGNPWGAGRVIGANNTDEQFIFSGVNNDVLVRYVGSDSVVAIPTHVKVIGERAFYNCSNVTTVYIPNTVTSIESEAFSGCNSLTGVDIPNSVTSIGEKAFANCTGLTFMSIPNSVEYVGANVFKGCAGLMVEYKPSMLRNASTVSNAIYCEASAQPAGWNKNWNADDCNTVWGAPFVTAEMAELDEIRGGVIYAGSYLEGREATFIAQATEGYHFQEWKEDGYTDSVRTVVMSESMVFTPLFAPNIDAVTDLSSDDNVLIYTADGTIFVENATREVCVFNMGGQLIARSSDVQSRIEITVPTGAYVVKTGNAAKVAIIR